MRARQDEDYGFRHCNWSKPAACDNFAKPFALFPAHSSPTGLAAIGRRLSSACSTARAARRSGACPVSGGEPAEVVSGFPAPVVAVGASGRDLHVGDLTGTVYRIRPS